MAVVFKFSVMRCQPLRRALGINKEVGLESKIIVFFGLITIFFVGVTFHSNHVRHESDIALKKCSKKEATENLYLNLR
ncbi:iron transporter [Vibrio cholerae]|nr:iron transporter [Vibrio cholerae]